MDISKGRVQVNEGILQGKFEETQYGSYFSFKGIPYAKPPLGHLRFTAPQAPEKWEGIKDASEHRDVCLQNNVLGGGTVMGSEDCLYLNVYTPNIDGNIKRKFPVMVFIHGGGFFCGSGDSIMLGPEYLVAREVVLVTLNYRLEVLGFLCVDTEDVPGNAGMKDQVAAMRWIKENISNFGGDPDNITLFGESAGSASVSYHLVSPMSKNLFHAAITQSGVCTNSWALCSDATSIAFRLGKFLGKNTNDPKELIEFLRAVPAIDLIGVTPKILTKEERGITSGILFSPVVEKSCLPGKSFINKHPKELLSMGEINSVPLITGYTDGEGMLFISMVIKNMKRINTRFSTVVQELSGQKCSDEIANKIKSFYFKNLPFNNDTLENMVHFRTDLMFARNIYNFANEFSSKSKYPVYFYMFSCRSELNVLEMLYGAEGINLTAHGEDLFYLFSSSMTTSQLDFSSKGGKMASKLLYLWTNMAKYRNPTPDSGNKEVVKWIPISSKKFSYMHMSDEFEMKINPNKERMDFLNRLFNRPVLNSKY